MSLYGQYIKERTNKHILETSRGFAVYSFIKEKNAVYIEDIYILPEFRKNMEASELADAICAEAKELGYTRVLGSVIPSANSSTASLQVLLAYGMKLDSAHDNFILFSKELGD